MKKLLLAVPFALLLSGCGAPSVEDLIEDPERLGEIVQKCNIELMQGKDISEKEECQNAIEAQTQMVGNLMDGVMKEAMKSIKR